MAQKPYSRWNPPPRYWKQFWFQRNNAKQRGIPFKLTFEEWLTIWKSSGHLPLRGKGSGKYCMAREGDQGAYEIGNVRIITHNKNSTDYVATPEVRLKRGLSKIGVPHSEQHRARIGAAHKGRVFSDETRRRMSIAARNRRGK